MIALRMNAPGLRSRYVRTGTDAFLAGASSGLVVDLPPVPAYRILPLGVPPKGAFSISRAGLSPLAVRLHGRLRAKHRPAYTPLRAVRPVIRGTRASCRDMVGQDRQRRIGRWEHRANHPWGSFG
jgi:hypothetical protein